MGPERLQGSYFLCAGGSKHHVAFACNALSFLSREIVLSQD